MQSIYPTLKYDDAHAAIDFLERAFGFERHAVHEGENGGVAQARFNQGVGRYALYIVVDDPDAHHDRAKAEGATVERELSDEDYGSRDYTARDPEGNLWSFGTYRPTTG